MKRYLPFLIVVLFAGLLFTGCATQSLGNITDPPGFLKGLLHGFILLFSFIASLFTDYEIYAFPNAGGWYNFGYLLGVMLFFGGGGAKARC
ncbi:hypothetical protein [Maribellus sp. YY47]|uniref:hypothetical protein n=1 Tax=Maribellus sp. YY47 TaxID=2929486 RepID=UPI002000D61B|nr:hypothetical protein [Maribellus sp. YY47]MCK3685960.1 hypothetical protein [Maribellus sp. YY47]